MSSIISIGLSGLNAAQAGMATTQHNIANANTPGYSMQRNVQAAASAQYTGSGFIGQGTNVSTVQRAYNDFIGNQLLQAQAQASQLSTYQAQITQIDNVLADPNAGLAPAMQSFFNSLQTLSNMPDSIPARQGVLSNAQSLVARFQSISQQLTDVNTNVNGQITNSVSSINSLAQQIAVLNQNIVVAQGTGQPPNDLMDQRDLMISQLNQQIKVSVVKQTDGSYNLFVGNGQPLVVGQKASSLVAAPSSSDPTRVDVSYNANGVIVPMQQNNLQGGVLGGLVAFRDQSLVSAQNALGRIAVGIADSVNQQNQLGVDINGALGGAVFSVGAPYLGAASNNIGNAVLSASITNANALTTSDYTLQATGGGSYTLIRLSDNTVTNLAALPQTVDGITINLASGASVAGDIYTLRPTVNASQTLAVTMLDSNKLAAAAPILANSALANLGSGKISNGAVQAPLNANVQAPVTITFNAIVPPATQPTYTVTGAVPAVGAPITYTPGTTIALAYNGWTAQISGTPAAGDVFNVAANAAAVGDNRNALLLAGLQTQNTFGGTTTLQGAYDQLVGQVANTTQAMTQSSTAQTTMVTQLVQAQQSVSGVNLDEEAANLIRYQRAYQAAGKAIQVANTMFDTLLNLR